MLARKDLDCFLERLLHLGLNNLLALPLDDVLRVVLTQLFVRAGGKAYDRRGSSVANIDANQHGAHVVHGLGELQVEQVALDLRVDLPQDVRSLAHVELEAVASRDDLRRNLELMEKLLVHAVVVLVAENNDHDLRVAEVTVRRLHHVVKQAILHFSIVVLGLHLQEVRLLNPDLQHAARLLESVEDVVGNLVVRSFPLVGLLGVLVDHEPLLSPQVYRLLDWQPSQDLFVDILHDLVLFDDLRFGQHALIPQLNRLLLNGDTPIL